MQNSPFTFITPLEYPDYDDRLRGLATACWPLFMLQDPVADQLWDRLNEYFPHLQFALVDTRTNKVIAEANSVALHWQSDMHTLPEGGWDWVFQQAVADHQAGKPANIQSAIQIAIHPHYRGQGLSALMVQKMRQVGEAHGFKKLIAPVRPSQKSDYPLINIDEYITWQREDGLPYDAWLRVHARAGAKIIKACHHAMEISGTREDWQKWTGLNFPQSGEYTLPGGLVPMIYDAHGNRGIYIEPNVWMVHELGS